MSLLLPKIFVFGIFLNFGNVFLFQLTQNSEITSDYDNRLFKFDLIAVPHRRERKIKVITGQTTAGLLKAQRPSRYLWDDIGRFWTYRSPNYYDSEREFVEVPQLPCQPPSCYSMNCDKKKCGRSNCMYLPGLCQSSPRNCGLDQKAVMFGNKVVCVNKDNEESCSPDCAEAGICIRGKCYCEKGYTGVTCVTMSSELCKSKKGLICPDGCAKDDTENRFKCICGENNDKKDCLEVRTCLNKCQNGATCRSGKCQCLAGYYGESCEQEMGPCAPGMMGNRTCEQLCINEGTDRFICKCREEYSLSSDGKSCHKRQCSKNGTIRIEDDKCLCKQGWMGKLCDEDVDECKSGSVCQQICHNILGSFECRCALNYRVLKSGICVRTCPNNCSDKGDCLSGLCHCFHGWHGDDCSDDIDECKYNHWCEHQCLNTLGSYVCQCPAGQFLQADKRNCAPEACGGKCQNGGQCENDKCICKPNFFGSNCEYVNYCDLFKHCEQICQWKEAMMICSCRPGYSLNSDGRSCSKNCSCLHGQCVGERCVCAKGFHGENCEEDVNECALKIHDCDQICNNSNGSFACSCRTGYLLNENGRSCDSSCLKTGCVRGECVNSNCFCPKGFTGSKCELDKDECETRAHGCDQICINTVGKYNCSCHSDYTLNPDGRTCTYQPCSARCINGECNRGICSCNKGFKGKFCDEDIDECSSGEHNCQSICENTIGSFHCRCSANFQLSADGRTCRPQSCGACVNGVCQQDGRCSCHRGYSGPSCTQDIDECKTWSRVCQHICMNTLGSYKCQCRPGYTLAHDEHSCLSTCSLCKNGKCDTTSGQCRCKTGWKGELCDQDVNECLTGSHGCEHNCNNKEGSYECSCQSSYQLSSFDGHSCIKEGDNCTFPCKNEARCINGKCKCTPGFTGDLCEDDIDECKVSKHGCRGECRNTFGNYECICPKGYEQLNDQKTCRRVYEDTMCNPPCQNGGNCVDRRKCLCPVGFDGNDCSKDIDECIRYTPCNKPHGTCRNTYGAYYCQCNLGYVLMHDGTSCMTIQEAILRPHLHFRGRGTKGYIPPIEK